MLPPATSVVVGATIEKRFPGYGVHRGSIVEIDGGRVVVHWAATDERTTLSLRAGYKDANGKQRGLGYFDTQEAAAHAVNAAIRRAGLARKRRTNPVVDGQLVPKKRKANGHGPEALRKRRRRLVGDSP